MERFSAVLALALCLYPSQALDVGAQKKQLRHEAADSFIRALEFQQHLRVCNAYPMDTALDIYDGKDKISSEALNYKSCGEYPMTLKQGSNLDFKVGETTVGTFTINALPDNDAILQLVVFRHDAASSAVSFESHVFANLQAPQVAVMDTYKGAARAQVRIEDFKNKKDSRKELLRYDSVVAVNPGHYQVSLVGPAGGNGTATTDLVALPKQSYIVMRVGVEAQEGTAYPQEMVVFPQSSAADLGAAASLQSPWLALLAAAAALCLAGRV